jgi:glycosylphosphatidylinositol transamidase (GPIT) subunit GPI8
MQTRVGWRALWVVFLIVAVSCAGSAHGAAGGAHTNNWAVLVDTSRFWYNYRHSANTLTLYRCVPTPAGPTPSGKPHVPRELE